MKWRIFLFTVLVLVAGIGLYLTLFHRHGIGPKIGSQAPEFSLQDRAGKTISLSSLRGRPVLLNFWATWCGPCQEEMPSLEALYQRYRERGFVVLGVSLDDEGWPAVDEFLKRVPVAFPLLLDSAQSVGDAYQVYRIPETYIINAEGTIVDKFVGPQNYNQDLFFKKVERQLN